MIVSVTLNPSVDRTLFVDGLKLHDTNRTVRVETDAGGKGLNLSRIVDAMGGTTLAVAALGGDTGRFIEAVLSKETVPCCKIFVNGETRLNISIEDGTGHPPTTFNAPGAEITAEDWQVIVAKCHELAGQTNWACLGGSLPPGVPVSAYADLLTIFRSHGASVCVDADGAAMQLALEKLPDLVKPNQAEVGRLLGRSVTTLDDAVSAAEELASRGVRYALVSMGAMGAALVGDGQRLIAASPRIASKSTIGSGDSMIGGFLTALERGDGLADALRWGCAAGAATALSDGTTIGQLDDIKMQFPEVVIQYV